MGGIKTIKKKYRNQFYSLFNTPVLLFRMGKVGGISLRKSLLKNGYKPFVGFHNLQHLEKSKKENADFVKNLLFNSNRSIKIISPVREPIEREISAFFHFNYSSYNNLTKNKELNKLKTYFYDTRLKPIITKGESLKWFDEIFRPITGINVLNQDFDRENGYSIIEKGRFKVLIYQTELDDFKKEKLISYFLNLNSFYLGRFNEAKSKSSYAIKYEELINNFYLSNKDVKRIYQCPFFRKFYNDKQIEFLIKKWSRNS